MQCLDKLKHKKKILAKQQTEKKMQHSKVNEKKYLSICMQQQIRIRYNKFMYFLQNAIILYSFKQ